MLIVWHAVRKSVHLIALTIGVLNIGCAGVPATSPQNPAKGQLVLTSGVVDFGNVPVGSSTSQSLAITNQGNASITVSQINISGTGFTVASKTLPLSLAPGQNITTTVQFLPPSVGNASGQISFVSDA